MGERITKAYWITLVLYLLFFNANTELKQQNHRKTNAMYAEENHQKIIKTHSQSQQQLCYTKTDTVRGP